jgi:integration host factor subunit beta
MTRSELIARLAAQFLQLTAKDAELSAKAILEGMSEALARGSRIELRGFGAFALNHGPARSGRNPSTGETVPVPAKRVPHFTPGKELRKRVQSRHDRQDPTAPKPWAAA